ncbi:MAG: Glu/Leu/Phe/Val dehydrogenase, partial [Elusimicrobiota bacterium]
GISDVGGGLYDGKGLDIDDIMAYRSKHETIAGYTKAEHVDVDKVVELPCDILVPAAMENTITKINADKIKAKYIIEGANGPTSNEADRILHEKGVVLVPDILANAGGVTVSYFEWVQDMQAYFWTEKEINARLQDIIIGAFTEVYDLSVKEKVDMRMGAFMVGLRRLGKAATIRGMYP